MTASEHARTVLAAAELHIAEATSDVIERERLLAALDRMRDFAVAQSRRLLLVERPTDPTDRPRPRV